MKEIITTLEGGYEDEMRYCARSRCSVNISGCLPSLLSWVLAGEREAWTEAACCLFPLLPHYRTSVWPQGERALECNGALERPSVKWKKTWSSDAVEPLFRSGLLSLTSYVTLYKLLNHSEINFLICKTGTLTQIKGVRLQYLPHRAGRNIKCIEGT